MSPNNSTACLAGCLERKTTPRVCGSTGPPKYAVTEEFFSAWSLGKISPRATRAGLLMIRPTTKPSTATAEDGNIKTTDSLKRGSPSSGRATRKRALSSALPLWGLSCAVCAETLLRSKRQETKAAALDLRVDIVASYAGKTQSPAEWTKA